LRIVAGIAELVSRIPGMMGEYYRPSPDTWLRGIASILALSQAPS
jgi:hypothetical protein